MPKPVVGIIAALEHPSDYIFPGYPRAVVNDDYPRSIAAAGGVPLLIAPHDDAELIACQLDCVDALLLAGGDDVDPRRYGQSPRKVLGQTSPIRDAAEWLALDVAMARQLPVFGVCRGFQVLNAYFGGTLHQDNTESGTDLKHMHWANPAHPVHAVTILPDSFLAKLLGVQTLVVNSFHHQSVNQLAPELQAAAVAPDGLVEAAEWVRDSRFVAGVQWHPEMMTATDTVALELFRYFVLQARSRYC